MGQAGNGISHLECHKRIGVKKQEKGGKQVMMETWKSEQE